MCKYMYCKLSGWKENFNKTHVHLTCSIRTCIMHFILSWNNANIKYTNIWEFQGTLQYQNPKHNCNHDATHSFLTNALPETKFKHYNNLFEPSIKTWSLLVLSFGRKKNGITMATVSTTTRLLLCWSIVVDDNNTFTVCTVFLIPVVILSCFLYHTC